MNTAYGFLHVMDQGLNVAGPRLARVKDEICMLGRNHGVADTVTLESARFDKTRRVITRRVAENRTAARLAHRLARLARRQQFADFVPRARIGIHWKAHQG